MSTTFGVFTMIGDKELLSYECVLVEKKSGRDKLYIGLVGSGRHFRAHICAVKALKSNNTNTEELNYY